MKQHLKLAAHKLSVNIGAAWWYEENDGISVITEMSGRNQVIKIRWTSIRAALKRKDKRGEDNHE